LSEEDASHGVEAELLWAEDLGGGRFRIENIPFYIYGISYSDVVSADEDGDRQSFREVVARSGHSTYRILVKDPNGFESDGFRRAWQPLSILGCQYEVARRRWVAIDVPSTTDVFAVYELLEAGAKAGIWTFEEGHVGHPT
jgi:hypothetical protein